MKSSSHQKSSIDNCSLIELPRREGDNGSLTEVENCPSFPFKIQRVYYLYDVPVDSERGGHSHIKNEALIIAVSGSFTVTLFDGANRKSFTLNRPYVALHITTGIWRTLENFSSGSVCLVLASEKYDEDDYVRDFSEFMSLTEGKRQQAAKKEIKYPFLRLGSVNAPYASAMKEAAARVIDSGYYIGGAEVTQVENKIAGICGTPFAVGVSNGLDALRLILKGYLQLGKLKPGDEIIVQANTFIATILAITDCGLIPVFVDPDEDTSNLDANKVAFAISTRTHAIMPVHLYGRVCWSDELKQLAQDNSLIVIEDNCQAIGAMSEVPGLFDTFNTGGLGHAGAISFYPTKNVGALGDAGAITTHDPELAKIVAALRNYGTDRQYHNIYAGLNCRMDPMQAALLNVKIPYLKSENEHRAIIAKTYCENISNPLVKLPPYSEKDMVWHQYVVRVPHRDDFQLYLEANGVETGIHYPIPPHLQPCYSDQYGHLHLPVAETLAKEVVSLPISTCTSIADAFEISKIINSWKRLK